MAKCASEVWIDTVHDLLFNGTESKPRDIKIKEKLNYHTEVDMRYPILDVPKRKLGYRFMFREAWWIMDGRNTVDTITDFSKAISSFSNDGYHFDGAYGPRVVDQVRYIVDTLAKDRDSRQAVLTIWRPNPRDSKDIPCTVSIQWLIRNNIIYCIDNMRSSDIWLGWPYDIFNFTMLTGYIMLLLRERGIDNLELGSIFLNAGSQHIYENNIELARGIVGNYNKSWRDVNESGIFNPYIFDSPIHLKNYLKALSEEDYSFFHKALNYRIRFGRRFIDGN